MSVSCTPLCRYVDNSQAAEEEKRRQVVVGQLAKRVQPLLSEMRKVLGSFDASKSGFVTRHDILSACAAMGVVLSNNELDCLSPLLVTNEEGLIKYEAFLHVFESH